MASYNLKAFLVFNEDDLPITEPSSTDTVEMLIDVYYLITSGVTHNLNTTCHKLCCCTPLNHPHIVSGPSHKACKRILTLQNAAENHCTACKLLYEIFKPTVAMCIKENHLLCMYTIISYTNTLRLTTPIFKK